MPTPVITNPLPTTTALLNNLFKLSTSTNFTFLGHQDSLAYGRDWYYEKGRLKRNKQDAGVAASIGKSDVYDTVKKFIPASTEKMYPTIFGWDLGEYILNRDYVINGVVIDDLRNHILWVFNNGGINTISWHCINPDTKRVFNKTDAEYRKPGTVLKILTPNHPAQTQYLQWLDMVIDFFNHPQIRHIPIIFRPLHECNLTNIFWWDASACTAAEYKALWQLIVNRFKQRGVRNVLFAYSINDVWNGEPLPDAIAANNLKARFSSIFNSRKPDNNLYDVAGFDSYQQKNGDSATLHAFRVRLQCEALTAITTATNKVAAITETGSELGPSANWWTSVLGQMLRNNNIAYIMLWRNPCQPNDLQSMFYGPFPMHASAADFANFYNAYKPMFLEQARRLNFYV